MSPPRYRSLLDLAMNRTSYTCNSCTRTLLQQRTFFRPQQQQTRLVQTSQRSRQHAAPNMNDVRKSFDKRNENTIYYTLSIILGTVALSYGSVPLYKTRRTLRRSSHLSPRQDVCALPFKDQPPMCYPGSSRRSSARCVSCPVRPHWLSTQLRTRAKRM
jgi:hypothetical protein